VIIFGGLENSRTMTLSPENSLYVLNLSNFNWYIPKVTGKFPQNRSNHKTVVIGKYMVVTFGKCNIINLFFTNYLNFLNIFLNLCYRLFIHA
jgi:hypothetical protein